MICGLEGRFYRHLEHIRDIIGYAGDLAEFATVSIAIVNRGFYFFADTYGNRDRDAEGIANLSRRVAALVRRFGVDPKVALLANSSFGSAQSESAAKMREATAILYKQGTDFEVDGEMHGNTALNQELRDRLNPHSAAARRGEHFHHAELRCGEPRLSAGDGACRRYAGGADPVGAALPAHVLVPAATTRSVINMTALAAVEAQDRARLGGRI